MWIMYQLGDLTVSLLITSPIEAIQPASIVIRHITESSSYLLCTIILGLHQACLILHIAGHYHRDFLKYEEGGAARFEAG